MKICFSLNVLNTREHFQPRKKYQSKVTLEFLNNKEKHWGEKRKCKLQNGSENKW